MDEDNQGKTIRVYKCVDICVHLIMGQNGFRHRCVVSLRTKSFSFNIYVHLLSH